jgi:hypothetical protein
MARKQVKKTKKKEDEEEEKESIYITKPRLMPSFGMAIKDETPNQIPPEISKALLNVQKEIKSPNLSAVNPFYRSKYAPLAEFLKETRSVLTKHGLFLFQDTGGNGLEVFVQTTIAHESGATYTFSKLFLHPLKDTPQGMGSAITYGRRYQLASILGIVGEEDDDGNGAEAVKTRKKKTKTSRKKKKEKEEVEGDDELEKMSKKEQKKVLKKVEKELEEEEKTIKKQLEKEKEDAKLAEEALNKPPVNSFGEGVKEKVGGISEG